MSKTELMLIDRAMKNRGFGYVTAGYRTGRKNSSYGHRESVACGKLVKAGIIKIVSQTNHRDCKNAYSDHWHETVFILSPGESR